MPWWKEGAIYQVVVPSFQDTTGSGFGDLSGVIERLEYLQWLGVRGIWLTPFYPSPLEDMGYDVAGHQDVHPLYGTLDDFDRLVAAAHRRNLSIVLDWIANHTSSQHPQQWRPRCLGGAAVAYRTIRRQDTDFNGEPSDRSAGDPLQKKWPGSV